MTSNEEPQAVPEGPRPAESALVLLGGGIGIGAAVVGGDDHPHGWMMYERNGYRGFPGSVPFPGERGRPGYGGPWHMRRPFAARAPHANESAVPSSPQQSGSSR